ncbi:unnamed protein product [Sphagnum tenellum]
MVLGVERKWAPTMMKLGSSSDDEFSGSSGSSQHFFLEILRTRYLGDGHSGHPVIDYRVAVSRSKKRSSSNERAMAAGLSKMLRRFSMDSGAKANKVNADGAD